MKEVDITNKFFNIVEEKHEPQVGLQAIFKKEKLERLRDEFAMAALTGLLANPETQYISNKFLLDHAYEIANEALKFKEETNHE